MEKTTPCECTAPGGIGMIFCSRHKCQKTAHFVKLCQTSEKYFQAYERGEGPGQRVIRPLPARDQSTIPKIGCRSCGKRHQNGNDNSDPTTTKLEEQ